MCPQIFSDSQKCVERLQEIQVGNLAYVEGLKKDLSEAVNSKRVVENNLANARQLCEEYVNRLKELQDTNRELKIKVRFRNCIRIWNFPRFPVERSGTL